MIVTSFRRHAVLINVVVPTTNTTQSKHTVYTNRVHTERMFGNDWLLCNERFNLSLIIDRSHTELVLFTLVQAGDITLRRSTVLTDRCPLAGLFVLLLHDIVTDGLAAIVLQSTTGSVKMAQVGYSQYKY